MSKELLTIIIGMVCMIVLSIAIQTASYFVAFKATQNSVNDALSDYIYTVK